MSTSEQSVSVGENIPGSVSIVCVGQLANRTFEFIDRLAPTVKATPHTSSLRTRPRVELELPQRQGHVQLHFINDADIRHNGDSPAFVEDWPDMDGRILCYDVSNRSSFLDMLDLLAGDDQTPAALVGWDFERQPRQVERELGIKLANVFQCLFIERTWREVTAEDFMFIFNHLRKSSAKQGPKDDSAPGEPIYMHLKSQLAQMRGSSTSLPLKVAQDFGAASGEFGVYPMPRLQMQEAEDSSLLNENGEDSNKETISPSASSESIATRENAGHTTENSTYHSVSESDAEERRESSTRDILDLPSDSRASGALGESFDVYSPVDWQALRSPSDDGQASVISNASTSNERLGFTMDELIERLASPTAHDMEFTKVFLMLYRKFLRPSELLDRLMDRFDAYENKDTDGNARGAPINAVQLRVCNILVHWCAEYWCDFHSDIMRFTMHVFLEICSTRPAYAAICQKLGSLVFRDPPSEAEMEALDWGLPDFSDDEVDENSSVAPASLSANDVSELRNQNRDSTQTQLSDSGTDYGQSSSSNITRRATFGNGGAGPDIAPAADGGAAGGFASGRTVDRHSAASNHSGTSDGSSGSRRRVHSDPRLADPRGMPSTTTSSMTFLELDNEAIAQQLNVLESEIFRRIKPRDLLQHIWSRRYKGRHAPSVAASIGHFNFISSWVTTRILSQRKLKIRAQVLGKFMKIAQALRNSNNYNTLMAVLAGINSGAILRLVHTRKLLKGRQSYRNYQALEKLMSSEHAFAAYRQALKYSELPCIPYLGVFLRDMLYIDESKDKRADGTINLPKFLHMGDVILMIQNYQSRTYHVPPDPYITTLILSQPVMTEELAYERSFELEPRVSSSSPKRSSK
ncbi:ras guanine nucleotide exchange factor domain-containing protein [Fimicolochytrium jonesii]|uniref:ras guanine nucleotide exchange factor domain-containing protein n=1 Tax=Fimicolochytrium jonesii TaxID=1396493 RepID=UPI0022FE8CD5|nr:ras guanine nucleotide exchange factor domain-containing protein [Fimicolochytrium jonesii]KAI8818096.1 ras guanine nucleotide exchange factor domain-containing protein [Fimicolochytrium jonesii]